MLPPAGDIGIIMMTPMVRPRWRMEIYQEPIGCSNKTEDPRSARLLARGIIKLLVPCLCVSTKRRRRPGFGRAAPF